MTIPGLFAASATTEGITVRVQPHFAASDSDPDAGHWLWHYHIRLENGSDSVVQLIDRHWIIVDGDGRRRDVVGEGVIGEQPVLEPGGSYDYVSGCPLSTPSGRMHGHFGMIDATGCRMEVAIPPFDLVLPDSQEAG